MIDGCWPAGGQARAQLGSAHSQHPTYLCSGLQVLEDKAGGEVRGFLSQGAAKQA